MLNTFPILLYFSAIIPFVFRLVISFFFLKKAYTELITQEDRTNQTERYITILESFLALCLLVGFYTQISALLLIISTGISLIIRKKKIQEFEKSFYVLLFVILLSFLFTGAGILAFDLPL
ncbi:MAG: hypothetical protein V1851_02645 [Patescibacteria group bacterium]